MEEEQNDESHGGPLSPLNAVCLPGCANSSCKTQTGRRCSILACLETIPGVHFSNSPFCSASASSGAPAVLIAGTLSPFSLNLHSRDSSSSGNCISGYTAHLPGRRHPGDLPSVSQVPDPLFGRPCLRHLLLAMPRLRQRMRCRRGVSRGHASVNPPSPLSKLSSSSEDDDSTPPPASRGGGGRGRGRGRRAENSGLAGRGRGRARVSGDFPCQPTPASPSGPPGHDPPPDPHAHSSQPPPSDFSVPPSQPNPRASRFRGSTIRQSTQNAELRFHCTSFDSIITAFISVSLREEIPHRASPSPPIDLRPIPPQLTELLPEDDNKDLKTDSLAGKEDSSEENEYACRIEEEPMSSEHEG